MLYSHTLEEQKFFSFSLYLKSLLNKDSIYSSVVKEVLSEAKEYSTQKRDIFSVNSNNYQLIIFFASEAKDILDKINIDKISKDDYQNLLDFLESRPISLKYDERSRTCLSSRFSTGRGK